MLAIATALVIAFCFTLVSSPATTSAQGTGATINVFCLDYGKTFPEGQTIKAQGLALDKVRGGLAYALGKGYVTSQPYQVQLAVWNLQDGQPFHDRLNQGTAIAQEIVNNAGSAPSGDASSVANLTVGNVHETSPQAAYGTATIQGNANTQGLPVGFLLPASGSSFQNLVAVVSTGSQAQAATGAATATATVAATPTSAAAATASPTATSAPATAASAPTATATVSVPAQQPATGGGGGSIGSTVASLILSLVIAALGLGAAAAVARR